MSIEKLYNEYNLDIASPGDRHYRRGWVNTPCPHCSGTYGHHLGYNIFYNYYTCYRCGNHKIVYTLSKLLGIPSKQAYALAKEYEIFSDKVQKGEDLRPLKANARKVKFPSNITQLKSVHKKYLRSRGYNPESLIKKYGLLATGPTSFLKLKEGIKVDYRYRIIAPIYWGGQIVSFQGRDFTNKHGRKYLASPQENERVRHQHILYGVNRSLPDVAILVEGITDAWRFGSRAFATFGITYTPEQVRLISQSFKHVFILFDPEPKAQQQAEYLADELSFRNVSNNNVCLGTDPGDISQEEANAIIQDLRIKKFIPVTGMNTP